VSQVAMTVTWLREYSLLKVYGPIRKSDVGAFARALSHTLSFSSLPVAVDLREAETIHPKAVSEMVAVLNTPFPARLVEVLVSDRRPGLGDSVADSLYERPGEVPKHRP